MLLNLLKIWRTLSTLLDPYGGISALAEKITALFDLPDMADAEAVRSWARGLVDLGKTAADILTTLLGRGVAGLVDTTLERGTALLAHLVECDDAWREFYALILDLWPTVDPDAPQPFGAPKPSELSTYDHRTGRIVAALGPQAVTGATPAQFSPALIISIAGVVVQVLRWLTERRREKQAATAPPVADTPAPSNPTEA